MAMREILQEVLDRHVLFTFSYINTVKEFVGRSSEWISSREAEAQKMKREEERTAGGAGSRYKDEAELERGLKRTLVALKEVQMFLLEPVEKLAVSSPQLLWQNQVLQLSEGADLRSVQEVILVAQLLCPLLLSFKRDDEAFFRPRLETMEVMQKQLSLYIRHIQLMCDCFKNSPLDALCLDNITIKLKEDISDEDIEKTLSNITKLNEYRMDDALRLLFLFQDKHQAFMEQFREREGRMVQFLRDVEACALQLDDMNRGARISSVVGSSVGLVAGVLSIVGLALVPVTAGVSLGLVGAGAGLAGLSGVNNSVITIATKLGVNREQKKKAKETMERFMEDVNELQNCLNDVVRHHFLKFQENEILAALAVPGAVPSVVTNVMKVFDCISDFRALKVVASELPELGEAAARGTSAMSAAARTGFIALNAVFIGVDLFIIVKDSIALSNGSETELSRILRATAALWKSEVLSFQKMYEALEGVKDSEKTAFIF